MLFLYSIQNKCYFSIFLTEITCPTLSAPLNGIPPTCTNDNKFGSDCSFTCDVGYKLNHTDNLQCVETGTVIGRWNNKEPVCEGKVEKNKPTQRAYLEN